MFRPPTDVPGLAKGPPPLPVLAGAINQIRWPVSASRAMEEASPGGGMEVSRWGEEALPMGVGWEVTAGSG